MQQTADKRNVGRSKKHTQERNTETHTPTYSATGHTPTQPTHAQRTHSRPPPQPHNAPLSRRPPSLHHHHHHKKKHTKEKQAKTTTTTTTTTKATQQTHAPAPPHRYAATASRSSPSCPANASSAGPSLTAAVPDAAVLSNSISPRFKMATTVRSTTLASPSLNPRLASARRTCTRQYHTMHPQPHSQDRYTHSHTSARAHTQQTGRQAYTHAEHMLNAHLHTASATVR